jgi:hypothetical protein
MTLIACYPYFDNLVKHGWSIFFTKIVKMKADIVQGLTLFFLFLFFSFVGTRMLILGQT